MKKLYLAMLMLLIMLLQDNLILAWTNPLSSFVSKSSKASVSTSKLSKNSDKDSFNGDDSLGGSETINSTGTQTGSQSLGGTQVRPSGLNLVKTVQSGRGINESENSIDLSSFGDPVQQEAVQGEVVAIGSQVSPGVVRGNVIKIQPPQAKKPLDSEAQDFQTIESNESANLPLSKQQPKVLNQTAPLIQPAKKDDSRYGFKKTTNQKGKESTILEILEIDENGQPLKNEDGTPKIKKLDISSFSKKLKNAKTPKDVENIVLTITGDSIQDPAVMNVLQNDPEFKLFQSQVAAKIFKPTTLENGVFMMKLVTSFITEASYSKIGKTISKKTTNAIAQIPVGVQKKSAHYKATDEYKKNVARKQLDEVNANLQSSSEEKQNAKLKYDAASKQVDSNYRAYKVYDAVRDISNFIRDNKQNLLSKL